jgi:hypothetical protein
VLNLDFDYRKYLDTLAADGMMMTRTMSGTYCEPDGAFNITRNTLAPLPGRFIAPWVRSDQPGYAGGGNKFDLTRWDDAYFKRLKRELQGQISFFDNYNIPNTHKLSEYLIDRVLCQIMRFDPNVTPVGNHHEATRKPFHHHDQQSATGRVG